MRESNTVELSDLVQVFESVDWIVPPYIQLGKLLKLATRIKAVEPDDKHRLLEAGLRSFYNPDDIAVMLLERYNKTQYIADFKQEISEAIEAAQLGLFHAAVSTLIPVVEGVIRRLATIRGQPIDRGTNQLIREIDDLIKRQKDSSLAASIIDERILMLKSFKNFLEKKFLISTQKYVGTGNLNRHGILHGVFNSFGYDWNFYKVLSFLDLLCFFIALSTKRISALAPVPTFQSQMLAKYYRYLAVLRTSLLQSVGISTTVINKDKQKSTNNAEYKNERR